MKASKYKYSSTNYFTGKLEKYDGVTMFCYR